MTIETGKVFPYVLFITPSIDLGIARDDDERWYN
jgi:hypothetical protein